MPAFRQGELVLLTSLKGKKWLVEISDTTFSCHKGNVHLGDIEGKDEGDFVETHQGARLYLFRPTLADNILKLKRQTQIIYPKDLGTLLFYGDVAPGQRVLESGVGSGSLTLTLLRALGENGRLISVEKRPEFARLAARNVARFHGPNPPQHLIVNADIQHFSLREPVDRVFLDLPEPWSAVVAVGDLLKRGGLLVNFSTNVGQVQQTCCELTRNGFVVLSAFEMLKRNWMVDERRARPGDRMVGHSGFIVVAKKVSLEAPYASAAPAARRRQPDRV
jgi:tRNA (adenine57-N1/adenine58-N1)-methyltransferase